MITWTVRTSITIPFSRNTAAIGFGNMVNADRVIAVVSPDSAPIKRIVQDARDKGAAIDATYGRRTRAVIITDSDHVVLSAFEPEEVLGRFEKEQDKPTV